jgi:Bacterial Ig-like domain (group 1)
MFKKIALIVLSLALASCGGGGGNTLVTPPSSGGGSGTGTSTPAKVVASSNVSAILADGSTTATITALAVDANNSALTGVGVTFKASSGALQAAQTKTDASGKATVTLTTGFDPTIRTITIDVSAGGVSATSVTVNVIPTSTVAPVASLRVASSSPTIAADGSTTATISAYALDSNSQLMSNVPVSFKASSGGLAAVNSITDSTGVAKAVLSTAGDPTPRAITVSASTGSLTPTSVTVNVTAPSVLAVQLGSGGTNGVAFAPGALGVQNANLSAGGTTAIQAVLLQSDGTLYTQSATVNFSSPCAAQGLATLTPSVQTTTGGVVASYTATGCVGSDTVTATATVNGVALSASVKLNVAAATLGSIAFVSASPSIIALKGVGSTTGLSEQSVVTFKVLDQSGNAYPNASVNFSLSTTVGGLSLVSASGVSGVDGTVQATVQSGIAATPVRVGAALAANSAITTQSSQLVISTGIPAQHGFTLGQTAPNCPNVEALNGQAVTVPMTVSLSDRFNNPVPDGTAVSFHTDGGQVQGQCFTTGNPAASRCSVTWSNENPRKAGGRVLVLAVAIGEESFTDQNGNGRFDAGEPYDDIGEPYIDSNFNSAFDVGEYFYDFDNNGTYTGPNGKFDGLLCSDPSNTNACGTPTTAIGASALIITSGSTPDNIVAPLKAGAPAGTLSNLSLASGSGVYAFGVADVNGNPMPAGTTITLSTQSSKITIGGTATYTVGCAVLPGSYAFIVLPSTSALVGDVVPVILTVTSPDGVVTQNVYTINIAS